MKYWVYMNGEVPGSYEAKELAAMQNFNETSMVCPAEGGIGERNWQRAGQYPDIIDALNQASQPRPPVAPRAQDAVGGGGFVPRDPNDILNDAGARIFAHVTDLMKELETRREERALTQSLQRQVVELKNELMATRERIKHLEARAALIPGYEDREKKLQEFLAAARSEIKDRERTIMELNRLLMQLRQEIERVQRSEGSLSADLKHQAQIADELSRKLSEKELALAKAFSLIRRLEETLGHMVPASMAGMRRDIPDLPASGTVPSSKSRLEDETSAPPQEQAVEPAAAAVAAPQPAVEVPVQAVAEQPQPSSAEEPTVQEAPQFQAEAPAEASFPEPRPEAGSAPVELSVQEPAAGAERTLVIPRADGKSEAFTADSGEPEAPLPLPPEGEVKPIPAPWQDALKRISLLFKKEE